MDKPDFGAWFERHQVLKIAAYYVALGALLGVLYYFIPHLPGVFTTEGFSETVSLKGGPGALPLEAAAPFAKSPRQVSLEVFIAMLGSVLLMLPVAWVHILTRSRRGFSQSTVQTLIFLPIVVAGVMTLVQHSVALAFGLGGVVGAVAFRNRLEDPKDAIYIFLAIAVGLASGVQVLSVAASISIFFNIVVLLAWRFDFGRMPASLEAGIAQRRVEKVKAGGAADKDFVQMMDQHLLKSMTPDQLQALSARAAERGKKVGEALGLPDTMDDEEKKAKFDATLRIMMQPDDAAAVRASIEHVLEGQCKRWEFEKAGSGDGGRAMAQYKIKFKKSIPSTLVIESMRRSVIPKVVTIDVRDA